MAIHPAHLPCHRATSGTEAPRTGLGWSRIQLCRALTCPSRVECHDGASLCSCEPTGAWGPKACCACLARRDSGELTEGSWGYAGLRASRRGALQGDGTRYLIPPNCSVTWCAGQFQPYRFARYLVGSHVAMHPPPFAFSSTRHEEPRVQILLHQALSPIVTCFWTHCRLPRQHEHHEQDNHGQGSGATADLAAGLLTSSQPAGCCCGRQYACTALSPCLHIWKQASRKHHAPGPANGRRGCS